MADYDVSPIPGALQSATPLAPEAALGGSFLGASPLVDMLRKYGGGRIPYNPTVQPSGKIGDPQWAAQQAGVNSSLANLGMAAAGPAIAPEALATDLGTAAAPRVAAGAADAGTAGVLAARARALGLVSHYAMNPQPAVAAEGSNPLQGANQDQVDKLTALDAQTKKLTGDRQAAIEASRQSIAQQTAEAVAKVPKPVATRNVALAAQRAETYKTAVEAAQAPFTKMNAEDAGKPFDNQLADLSTQRGNLTTDIRNAYLATQPIQERNAPLMNSIRYGTAAVSPLIGGYMGYKGMPMWKAATGGAIAGAAPPLFQQYNDYQTGGPATDEAMRKTRDPMWWLWGLGGESATDAALSTVAHDVGVAKRLPVPGRTPPAGPPVPEAPPVLPRTTNGTGAPLPGISEVSPPGGGKASLEQAAASSRSTPPTIAPPKKREVFQSEKGTFHYRDTGSFASKEDKEAFLNGQ